MPRFVLFSLTLLLAACDSRDAPPPEMIPDPAQVGLPLAEVPPAPSVDRSRWLGEGDWALEPVSSFAAQMDDTVLVHTINALRPGPDGLLYLGMQQQSSITVVNLDGTAVRRIGRRGSGPGEFEGVNGYGWRNDSLWVLDRNLGRISWFGTAGEFLGTQPHEHRGLEPTAIGTFIGLPSRAWNATAWELQLLSASGDDLQTLHRSTWSRGGFQIPQGEGFRLGSHPQADEPKYAIHPGGQGMAVIEQPPDGGEVHVTWYGPDGKRRYSVSQELPTSPISAGDWESFLHRWYNIGTAPPIPMQELLRAIPRPNTWAPVTRTLLATNGRLLVRGPTYNTDTVTWTMISAEGVAIGGSRLPADLRMMYISGDTVWAVRPNADDLDVVTRFRLRL